MLQYFSSAEAFPLLSGLKKSIVFIWLEGNLLVHQSGFPLSVFSLSQSVSISPSVFISLSLVLTVTGAET